MRNGEFPKPPGSTTIIQRPASEIEGLRSATDESSTLAVKAFPFQLTQAIAAACSLAMPGCYLLSNPTAVYIGESSQVGRRLTEHLGDPSKASFDSVYVVHGAHAPLDKATVVHLQSRLTAAAEVSKVVKVLKGCGAPAGDLPCWRAASLDASILHAVRLLYDAGCRVFSGPARPGTDACESFEGDDAQPQEEDDDDTGAMQVGVSSVPPGVTEMELVYGNLFARGYEWLDTFVVAAGSEIRVDMNPSVIARIRARRDLLLKTVTAPISGADGRVQRLTAAVAFPSPAIAGKVIAGAHIGSDKWRPLAKAPLVISG